MFVLEDQKPEFFKFEYKGEVREVPRRDSLPMPTFRRMQKAIASSDDAYEALFDAVMEMFDEYIPDVMAEIDLAQAKALFTAYSHDGDAPDLGESSASSD